MAASNDDVPYWVLLSVLTSTVPLGEGLALALHRVAMDLFKTGTAVGHLDHELSHGQVKNLHKEVLLGTEGGPSFEAELETERGRGLVRFFLTRRGLALLEAREAATRRVPELLH